MILHSKKPYTKPLMTVTTVKFEDPICSASAQFVNGDDNKNATIVDQGVNTGFEPSFSTNTTTGGTTSNFSNGWEVPVITTPTDKK